MSKFEGIERYSKTAEVCPARNKFSQRRLIFQDRYRRILKLREFSFVFRHQYRAGSISKISLARRLCPNLKKKKKKNECLGTVEPSLRDRLFQKGPILRHFTQYQDVLEGFTFHTPTLDTNWVLKKFPGDAWVLKF